MLIIEQGQLVAGRYRLVESVGSGGMGIVWRAEDERLERTVAIKQLLTRPGLSEEQAADTRRRAMREARTAARLQHRNAIALFDVAEHDGDPWLVMEFLRSRSLSTVLADRGTLPVTEVANIGAQVASALAAAHTAGIVHRDVKPGNILLGDDGSVKITDFGISRAADDVTVTKTGMIAGTPAYLAPEVAIGRDPTPASDVFSLGSTLYAAVEGEPPFGLSENTLGLLHRVAAGKINPPRQAGPLTDVLIAMLATEPELRPSTSKTRDLLAAVGRGDEPSLDGFRPVAMPMPVDEPTTTVGGTRTRLVAGPTEVVRTRPAAALPAPAKRDRSRQVVLVLAGALLVALIAAGAWLLANRNNGGTNPADNPNSQVPLPVSESSSSAPPEVTTTTKPPPPATRPPQTSTTTKPKTTTTTTTTRTTTSEPPPTTTTPIPTTTPPPQSR